MNQSIAKIYLGLEKDDSYPDNGIVLGKYKYSNCYTGRFKILGHGTCYDNHENDMEDLSFEQVEPMIEGYLFLYLNHLYKFINNMQPYNKLEITDISYEGGNKWSKHFTYTNYFTYRRLDVKLNDKIECFMIGLNDNCRMDIFKLKNGIIYSMAQVISENNDKYYYIDKDQVTREAEKKYYNPIDDLYNSYIFARKIDKLPTQKNYHVFKIISS